MIGVQIRINNTKLIANIQCIRKAPRGDVKKNQMCTYEVRVFNQPVGELEHPYGDAIELAKAMLDFYNNLDEEEIVRARGADLLKRVIKENNDLLKV